MAKAYHAANGSKLEYCATQSGSYTQLKGLTGTPEIGGEPNQIDTTDLDNTEYETAMNGLKPAQKYNFEFNMEDPSVNANIKLASDIEDVGTAYYWKLTYSNGIVVSFKSSARTTIKEANSGDLLGFTLHLAPEEEPTVTIPNGASL